MKKAAIITGGSGGIGSEICFQLARQGWLTAVCYNGSQKEAEKVAAGITTEGYSAKAFHCDISSVESIAHCVSEVGEEFGEIGLLVNNAGTADINLFTDISDERLLELIKISPSIALELLELQAKRIRQLSTQIDSMTFLQADGRIAQLLLQSMQPYKGKMQVRLTHEEIGSTVGVSRVTVSKILNSFVKKGYVQTEYGHIIICDSNGLRELIDKV